MFATLIKLLVVLFVVHQAIDAQQFSPQFQRIAAKCSRLSPTAHSQPLICSRSYSLLHQKKGLHTSEDEPPPPKNIYVGLESSLLKSNKEPHKNFITDLEYQKELIGIGGTYGDLQIVSSKKHIVESDHFPPESVYKFAKDSWIRNINRADMAALSIPYRLHKDFTTTGAVVGNQGYRGEFVTELSKLMREGKYDEVVRLSILEYNKSLGDKTHRGNNEELFDYYKPGILAGLKVQVKNGLLSEEKLTEFSDELELTKITHPVEDTALRKKAIKAVNETVHTMPKINKNCTNKKRSKSIGKRDWKTRCGKLPGRASKAMRKGRKILSNVLNSFHPRHWRFAH
ncbi:uncharacterized protein LOC118433278 [Folsomia candida]|uniref:uncharacterized protein LOC118433278 n=1 Tax=Folsomia candida TaxID=158441 RepID=UPI00160514CD|nr:uncharacterized protein LOC118433278 [Folsomia candida]